MNKHELIAKLSESQNITKDQAAEVVRIFFNQVCAALERGDRVEIRGMGSLCVRQYKSYSGRNPKTGEEVTVPAKKMPYFKCGIPLFRRMNEQS